MSKGMRLDGQVAIVTGAGRGVGRGIAMILADAGATIVGTARTAEELNRTVADIQKAGGKALAVTGDVMKRADNERAVKTAVEKLGRIDILVNNAGGQETFLPFLEATEDEFRHHFEWNTISAFVLSQLVTPHMLRVGKGSIVNISSGAGHIGIRGMMAYCVAKGALDQLTRALGQELAPKIRVNGIALGAILTPALQKTKDERPDFFDGLCGLTPLRRLGTAEDIGNATLYLCSPSCYATGAILHVDGGLQDTNLPFKLPDL